MSKPIGRIYNSYPSASPVQVKATSEDVLAMYADKTRKMVDEAKQVANEITDKLTNLNEFAKEMNGVKEVTEENGVLTITKVDGTETTIKLVKSVNGEYADENGNVVLPKEIEITVLGDSKV
jgi:phosphoglucomutase